MNEGTSSTVRIGHAPAAAPLGVIVAAGFCVLSAAAGFLSGVTSMVGVLFLGLLKLSTLLAVLGIFVVPLACGLFAAVMGHIARRDMNGIGPRGFGQGAALAGLVLGYIDMLWPVVGVCGIAAFLLWMGME